jgi:hypothetical protein
MSCHRLGIQVCLMWGHTATTSVFARLLAPVFRLPTSSRFRSSAATLPAQRDGTDPLLGGNQADRLATPDAADQRPQGDTR